jgi:hypothetical protein
VKRIQDLFHIVPGHDYELCNLTEKEGGIPFVSRTAKNNGISAYIEPTVTIPTAAGCLTVALGGMLSTFLQTTPCYESFHIATLHPRHQCPMQKNFGMPPPFVPTGFVTTMAGRQTRNFPIFSFRLRQPGQRWQRFPIFNPQNNR